METTILRGTVIALHQTQRIVESMCGTKLQTLKMYTENPLPACRCASATSSLAWACIQLGVSPATESVDRYTGQATADSIEQRFARCLPAAFRDHVGALLPGFHAIAYSGLLAGSVESAQARALFQKIMKAQSLQACLKVGDKLVFRSCIGSLRRP